MKGDLACVGGRITRHDPQPDDPELETDIGECPDCSGQGCDEGGGDVPKPGRSQNWLRDPDRDLERQRDDKE